MSRRSTSSTGSSTRCNGILGSLRGVCSETAKTEVSTAGSSLGSYASSGSLYDGPILRSNRGVATLLTKLPDVEWIPRSTVN